MAQTRYGPTRNELSSLTREQRWNKTGRGAEGPTPCLLLILLSLRTAVTSAVVQFRVAPARNTRRRLTRIACAHLAALDQQ